MPDYWPLLVHDPLDGDKLVNRQLRPRAIAQPIDRGDFNAAAQAAVELCNRWGGGAMPLMPVTPGESVEGRWGKILTQSNIDAIAESKLLDADEIRKYSEIHGASTQLLLRIVVDLEKRPTVQTCRGVARGNPWYLSYLATLGDLPTTPDHMNTWNDLRQDLTYQDALTVRGVDAEPGANALLAILREHNAISAIELTRIRLAAGLGATYNKGFPEHSRFNFDDNRIARQYGPNIVVVYEPGSVEDLALIWNLRAQFAHPRRFPLALPRTDHVGRDLQVLANAAAHYFGFGHNLALTSFSVDQAVLTEIGQPHQFDVVEPWNLMGPIGGYCVTSTEVARFTNGIATVPSFSPTDIQALGQSYLGAHQGTWLKLKTTVADNPLPASYTIRYPRWWGQARYLDGQITTGGKLEEYKQIHQPAGLEVLSALIADHGVIAAESAPGKAAEQIIRASDARLAMFASPGVTAALIELSRGRHVSLVRRRLNQFLDPAGVDESTDRYELLFDRIDRAVGDPDPEEAGYMQFSRLRELLRMSESAAQVWLQWATTSRLILRGVEAKCDRCGHKQWRPLSEVVPTLICHGCGRTIENPHGFNHIEYRYRASESLLRAMSHDTLPCILAMHYITNVMGGRDGGVFGAYPGIELRQPGASNPYAEIDLLVALRNGGLILGECKTNARGLRDEELPKLWAAADTVGARATFAATLDRAANCGELWRVQADPNGRPHFALTAEHLYDFDDTGPSAMEDLFDWRDDYPLGILDEESPPPDQIDRVAIVDQQFSDYVERVGIDYSRLNRAPWMESQ
jgi:hypothetical protein